MSTGNQRRTRSELVAGLRLPPGRAERLLEYFRHSDVLLRVALALAAAIAMWGITGGWAPQFPFRAGYVPDRDIVARTPFHVADNAETENRRRQARSQALCVYSHDRRPLVELRRALKDSVFRMISVESFEELNAQDREVWGGFLRSSAEPSQRSEQRLFEDFRRAVAEDPELARFERAVQAALADFERDGLLVNLEHRLGQGSQRVILVQDTGSESFPRRVEVEDVRVARATADLQQRLEGEFAAVHLPGEHLETLSRLTFNWLANKKLPVTLKLDQVATQEEKEAAAGRIKTATKQFQPGEKLAEAGRPLDKEAIDLLEREHRARVGSMTLGEMLRHSLADLGMYIALYVLCGSYLYFHHRRLLTDWQQLSKMLALVVVTVTACMMGQQAEMIPLVLFGTTVALTYQRELALLLSAAVVLVVTISTGQQLGTLVIWMASVSASILLLGRVRSRTKLIYVGLGAGVVAGLTTMGIGTFTGQSFGWPGLTQTPLDQLHPMIDSSFAIRLLVGSLWFAFCAVLSGIFMTGLLPFIERLFDVQTDISLLELGDAAHPLLQELVRRAPGTYNHSITVASIAEAAAEAIGAHGLLVRVAAYFHDIGKMLKPGYFIENQSEGINRHDALVPAMSTLVIIAHVKDGADLARRYHLPRSIIDFIEQHHGTTLVEYFYREATRRREENPDSNYVDETSFRYPGPKPQSREAGVLMMADAAESICRTLVDPAPARIESVVRDLALKRLLDGQFDECGLTLRELRTIETSLVKSLTAVYHGRIKYPDQQTA